MTKPIPPVSKYMTTSVHTVGEQEPMARAHRVMREHHIRHLPVLSGGQLVGIVSDGDLHLLETLREVDPAIVRVDEAMTQSPYSVDAETPLDEVVKTMAERKYGCAIVMQNHKVVGIFTTVDACRAFAEMLHGRLTK